MIKDLRKKFIIVAMCSTFGVLTAIMGIANVVNYCRIINRADSMITLLAENNGSFGGNFKANLTVDFDKNFKEPIDDRRFPRPENFSPETPFETRFFTVTLDEEGDVLSSDIGKIAAISRDEAEEYAEAVFYGESAKGFKGIYRYKITESDKGFMIIFLDCRQDLDSFKAFALTSVIVSALGLLAVFILVLIFSKIVFRPVEMSYEKQKQFITDASHEIKTPLTIIDANTEVLEMENGENQWTKSTRNQIKRLSYLTHQLVTLSRLDEEADRMERVEMSLSNVVVDSVDPFYVIARTHEKSLLTDIEEGITFVGNEESIRQLVSILMDNAIKYSIDKGNIKVVLYRKGKKIYLEVYNQVDNIPQGNLEILFERFYRMDESRNSETGGTGIGLSVAKAIVISHKGKIAAYSDDGSSLTIKIEFKTT